MVSGLRVKQIEDFKIVLSWDRYEGAEGYNVYWADKDIPTMKYKNIGTVESNEFKFIL